MGDGSIIALMSVVIRDRRTKGGLCCSGHESMRPVAVCEGGRREVRERGKKQTRSP